MKEYIDIVDENNVITGKIEDKQEIHKKGIWHREIGCWIMNNNNELLLQKRAISKSHGAGKWDITGGHIKTSEKPECAIIRELKEEIGLIVNKKQLELLEIDKRKGITSINNAFYYQFFIYSNNTIDDYIIQKEELSEVKYVSIKELEYIVNNKNDDYVFSKRDYMKEIIKKLKNKITV